MHIATTHFTLLFCHNLYAYKFHESQNLIRAGTGLDTSVSAQQSVASGQCKVTDTLPPPTPGTNVKSLKSTLQTVKLAYNSLSSVTMEKQQSLPQQNNSAQSVECRFVKRPKIIVPVYIILVLRALPIMVARKSFYTIVVPS